VLHLTLTPITDFAALGHRWQALEADARGGFFRSWVFLGCQAETRFAGALLLCATQGGEDVALALIRRVGGKSWLNETGDPVADSVFIEHNGLLVRDGHTNVIAPALRFARQKAAPLMLSGIDAGHLEAARSIGWCSLRQTRLAPYVDLTILHGPYLDTLSANARAQIRRSLRLYGGPRLDRADTLDQANGWFAQMMALHQAAWQRRGKPGAFAEPAVVDFHTALIARAWPAQNVDLLRISAEGKTIGILYTFIKDGRVLLYQSGFAYADEPRLKPGLVCHSLAIQDYTRRGFARYDLLGGADRYKKTLAHDGEDLHWAILNRPWSVHGLIENICSFVSKKSLSLAVGKLTLARKFRH
jgi:CelD/BcsL family acetyltransferase involved in cellulose biosynthesis